MPVIETLYREKGKIICPCASRFSESLNFVSHECLKPMLILLKNIINFKLGKSFKLLLEDSGRQYGIKLVQSQNLTYFRDLVVLLKRIVCELYFPRQNYELFVSHYFYFKLTSY